MIIFVLLVDLNNTQQTHTSHIIHHTSHITPHIHNIFNTSFIILSHTHHTSYITHITHTHRIHHTHHTHIHTHTHTHIHTYTHTHITATDVYPPPSIFESNQQQFGEQTTYYMCGGYDDFGSGEHLWSNAQNSESYAFNTLFNFKEQVSLSLYSEEMNAFGVGFSWSWSKECIVFVCYSIY